MSKIKTINLTHKNWQQDLNQSFIDTGFAIVTNHGIDQSYFQNAYKLWERFFNNSQLKYSYKFNEKVQAGYFPPNLEKAKNAKVPDLKEFFHYFGNNPKAYDLPEFLEQETKTVFFNLESLGIRLLKGLTEANSALKAKLDVSQMVENSPNSLLRVLHYPPLEGAQTEGAVRAAAHQDINLITLLPAATQSGLEVLDLNGEWHKVESLGLGEIVINAGDMLAEMDGTYVSTSHRVVNPLGPDSEKSRYSMPLFLHPKSDTVLSDRHTAGSFLNERLRELGLIK